MNKKNKKMESKEMKIFEQGENWKQSKINVLLNKKDEQMVDPIHIADVRIALDYIPHRNALRDEETYEE